MTRTIQSLLATASQEIQSDSPRLDAELLLCKALDKPRSYLFSWPEKELDPTICQSFEQLLQRRIKGEPIAHILGEQEFWSHTFKVAADTLIPRADTEVLVEQALNKYPPQQPIRIADLGTGTGCIAISIALEHPRWSVLAVDKSPTALAVAQANADRLGAGNVECVVSDWMTALQGDFEMIISNPPYIREQDEHLSQGDVRFEPRSALTAGEDGLEDIRIIAKQARKRLKPGGTLLLEFGYDQSEEVATILREQGFEEIQEHRDLAGIIRAISAK